MASEFMAHCPKYKTVAEIFQFQHRVGVMNTYFI